MAVEAINTKGTQATARPDHACAAGSRRQRCAHIHRRHFTCCTTTTVKGSNKASHKILISHQQRSVASLTLISKSNSLHRRSAKSSHDAINIPNHLRVCDQITILTGNLSHHRSITSSDGAGLLCVVRATHTAGHRSIPEFRELHTNMHGTQQACNGPLECQHMLVWRSIPCAERSSLRFRM